MRLLATRVLIAVFALTSLTSVARAEIEIVPVTSPGGITAWLYEDHSIPILSIEASFRGGTALDPEGSEGAVNLMASLLEEGSGDLDATGFAKATEEIAANFGFGASIDAVSVSADMLTEYRDESINLLRSALVSPTFKEDAFSRVQTQMMSVLSSEETNPNAIARRTFNSIVFEGHVYGRPAKGTLETVPVLDADVIRAAHKDALVLDRLKLSVVGDITAEELAPMLDHLFGDLPESGPERADVIEVATDGSVTVVDLDIPQSIVVFGQAGIPRNDPDFIPAFVMDQILGGGGFGSRLTEEVREKRGLSYGIYSYLAPRDLGWIYAGGFSSANEVVAQAVEIVRDEWVRMAADGVTDQELEDAKRYLTGAYPLRFDGNSRIAGQLLGLQVSDLSLDYVNERNDLVEAVTREDIQRVATRILDSEKLSWVIVGRPEGISSTN